ncbi:MAG: NAD(P)-dependent glycerol-3-phosphate dehydrogenase [Armatimonadetes bacterium]|nr:NAD(P)-dependent glycerol-3-phosphate dehydrogenase [Candidatus Hippobium faecium]
MKVCVLGAGSWGTALSMLASLNNESVSLWTNEESVYKDIRENGLNSYYTKECPIPANVTVYLDIEEALCGAEFIIMAIPSQAVREVYGIIKPYLSRGSVLLNAGKGLEASTGLRNSQILTEVLGEYAADNAVFLSGPNLALEFARKKPGCTLLASHNSENAKLAQKVLSSEILRCYTATDVIGMELGGSLKNVMAIASGISTGLGFGFNATSALLTRGLKEITRLGVFMGAKLETFYGLSGLGDMITTATSDLSRNFRLGLRIAEGMTLEEAKDSLGQVAEGVPSCQAAMILSEKFNIEMPITAEVYKILFEGKDPHSAVKDLMLRDFKEE